MKRTHEAQAFDPTHPVVAFHREVLIVQQWTALRQAFLAVLQDPQHGITWQEPQRLWRHSQEALGKWILSQVARVTDEDAVASLHFFPTRAMVAAFPGGASYDAQLIRDLSLKSDGATRPETASRIERLVRDFSLADRCDAAHTAVAQALVSQLSSSNDADVLRPRLRRVEESDPRRSPAQQRVQGPIAEFSVMWPSHCSRSQTRLVPPVSIPWVAWKKLRRSYAAFGLARDHAQEYSRSPLQPGAAKLLDEDITLLRAATVALRYEGGLATGSLQLCADTALKQHLHAVGYHVVDLCASPINAYMGVPQRGVFGQGPSQRPSSLEGEHECPNRFCSAFEDTDVCFGSLGSALRVDPLALHASVTVNPLQKPLLLTLDVPYDEDLCELLFDKLRHDMQRVEAGGVATSCQVDYVLVLPLWWRIPMQIVKSIYVDDPTVPRAARESRLDELLSKRCTVLSQGFQVPYHWPENLSAAAGAAGAATAWLAFDGAFIGNRYSYFCTATNKWLQGVTTTEVIGLAQPRVREEHRQMLRTALREFYAEG